MSPFVHCALLEFKSLSYSQKPVILIQFRYLIFSRLWLNLALNMTRPEVSQRLPKQCIEKASYSVAAFTFEWACEQPALEQWNDTQRSRNNGSFITTLEILSSKYKKGWHLISLKHLKKNAKLKIKTRFHKITSNLAMILPYNSLCQNIHPIQKSNK